MFHLSPDMSDWLVLFFQECYNATRMLAVTCRHTSDRVRQGPSSLKGRHLFRIGIPFTTPHEHSRGRVATPTKRILPVGVTPAVQQMNSGEQPTSSLSEVMIHRSCIGPSSGPWGDVSASSACSHSTWVSRPLRPAYSAPTSTRLGPRTCDASGDEWHTQQRRHRRQR